MILEYTNGYSDEIEIELMKLTKEIKENDFNENSLNKLKEKLKTLEHEFNRTTNISIENNLSLSLINQTSVIVTSSE